jgi:hypothetical protein
MVVKKRRAGRHAENIVRRKPDSRANRPVPRSGPFRGYLTQLSGTPDVPLSESGDTDLAI